MLANTRKQTAREIAVYRRLKLKLCTLIFKQPVSKKLINKFSIEPTNKQFNNNLSKRFYCPIKYNYTSYKKFNQNEEINLLYPSVCIKNYFELL